ncbi:MAG: deoxyribose-phosphate aldolase [Bacilli bacterium]|jgi:deoxyribose-phosphate aldolase|nr:deoxyribose-phosphate aldolase [Bacilli bacterium]MCH4211020.1 deoxyribose-phosphate aldolase [Bacilli bacterium]MCH4228252.1 deoxyribose-phosphate aldolase [Bacilli bacterium]MCH4277686.1 deoxyribose-phosphate aldolase [Bacilli bacterium]MCI2054673.1 deoxyribose-phosphate aldolase [Bacilli bacterium]
MKYNKFFDHTCLKADATLDDITKLCQEAKEYDFMTVCVNPFYVPVCKKLLEGSDVKVCTVIGFPLGQMTPKAKAFEAKNAVSLGADEVDMVQNIAMAKEHDFKFVEKEIRQVKAAIGEKTLKVILENCYLTKNEIVYSCKAAKAAGADFVKTSTGFGSGGATVEDVALMRETVGPLMGVKAAGGIHNKQQMLELLAAGANRIGCSHSVAIMNEK